ncbi:MAG: hypothetical protein WB507_01560 [Solirubrobacterales bacterium]
MPLLTSEGIKADKLCHWILIVDDRGVTATRLEDDTQGMDVSAVQASHLDEGASSSAFITHVPEEAASGTRRQLLAQVLICKPNRDSDIQRAYLSGEDGCLELGEWEPTV